MLYFVFIKRTERTAGVPNICLDAKIPFKSTGRYLNDAF